MQYFYKLVVHYIKYKSNKLHPNADAMSRLPVKAISDILDH